ncbi:MAG: MFS transporter, partial [Parvularculaceae bacterium]|nr:MFS transporter [Parvularculaceae bacterium]
MGGKATEKLPLPTKLAYGVGSVGEQVFFGMFNSFITIYYNQALGLSNSLIGLAIMVALLGDAVSDPAVGMISDRWRSKLGRRHPFLFAAPIPVAIAVYCVFQPPEGLTGAGGAPASQTGLFLWLCIWTVLARLFLTLYTIPHFALGGELTKNAHERSKLFSINSVFGYMTGALFAFVAWGYFLGGETTNASGDVIPRHLDAAAYGPLVLTASGVILLAITISAWGTYSRIPTLSAPPAPTARFGLKNYYLDILNVAQNRNYLFLIAGFFFFMISVGMNETFAVFVNTYVWELGTGDMKYFGLAAAPAIVIGALLAPWLMKRFDRRPVLLCAMTSVVLMVQLPLNLRLLGLFVSNESHLLLPLLLGQSAIISGSIAVGAVAVLSMLGDVADQLELEKGTRQEGLIYSARTFFAKASNSAGHFFAGILLDIFIRLPFGAVPGNVEDDVIFRLALAGGPIMSFAALVAIPLYARY